MVQLFAEVRNRGTNTIGKVICHGDKLSSKPLCAVSRYKNGRISNLSRYKIC
jgi:hypothetical protein